MSRDPFVNTTSGLKPNAGVSGTPGAITATSVTTQAIGLGTIAFQIPSQAAFAPGMFVSAVDANNASNYMIGVVQSYSDTTLTVDVLNINGSGTISNWLINLTGPTTVGAPGNPGTPGAPGAAAGPMNANVRGLKVTNNATTPATKIDVTALSAVMVNGGVSVRASTVAVTIDLTTGTSTPAANGMDGEARGTSSWIYLYLISDSVTTAGFATKLNPLAGVAATLPAGYTSRAYLGAMFVDGSGNLLRTMQKKNRTNYMVTSATNTATMPVLANGVAGSTTAPTWISVSTASAVPPTASDILIVANGDVGATPANVIVAPNNAYGTATSTNPPPISSNTAALSGISPLPLETANIFWASSGIDGYMLCAGWFDYVSSV